MASQDTPAQLPGLPRPLAVSPPPRELEALPSPLGIVLGPLP